MELTPYNILLILWFMLALATFISLFFVTAPYGRHARRGWGPSVSARMGWILMEAPAPTIFAVFFFLGVGRLTLATSAFFVLWQLHYVYRAFIYPIRHRSASKRMPLVIVGVAFGFGLINTYLVAYPLYGHPEFYADRWLSDPRFLVGTAMFLLGMAINRQSDRILHDLRGARRTGYKMPAGGLYRWVSCPNYLGEIVQWFGWALATWTLGGLAFAIWTVANLAPRARSHHLWYQAEFPDYPAARKALLPFVW
jgi:protein-S-isoprenylcysteine O-methyltransferase Ste14